MEITTNWVAKRIEKNFTVTETGSPRDFSSGSASKESTCPCRRYRRCRFDPWVRKSPWSRKWQPILVFLPGKSHGQKSLVGYSPWSCKELDMTECVCVHACACAHTHTHTHTHTLEVQDQRGSRLVFSPASSWLADGYLPLQVPSRCETAASSTPSLLCACTSLVSACPHVLSL